MTKKSASVPKLSPLRIEQAKARYLQKVREKIQAHRYYPRIARKLRQTGRVEVQFVIRKDGRVSSVTLVERCGHRRLDKAARETIERIGRFDPLPKVLGDRLKVRVPIHYQLR